MGLFPPLSNLAQPNSLQLCWHMVTPSFLNQTLLIQKLPGSREQEGRDRCSPGGLPLLSPNYHVQGDKMGNLIKTEKMVMPTVFI